MAGLLVAGPLGAQLPLGDPLPVNVETASDQDDSRIGMRDDGRFVVLFRSGLTSNSDVWQRTFDAAGTPFAPSQLNEFTPGAQVSGVISMNRSGDWIAVWSSEGQVPGSARDLFARRTSNNGSTLGSEFPVNATTAHDTIFPFVSLADDDSSAFAWLDAADASDIQFRRFSNTGTPVTGDLPANEDPGSSNGNLVVESFPDGSFVVVWRGPDAVADGVQARCFDSEGVALGNQFRVNVDENGDQQAVGVAADRRGAFVVVWRQGSTSGQLAMRLFHPDCTPRSGDLPVNDVTSGSRLSPRVEMAADGAFAVTWSGSSQDPDGGASVREFTRSGTPVGGQFLAHGEAGRPRATSAVAIGAGIFAVSWSEREASPSVQDDVFVRRFRRRVIFTDDFESEDLLYWTLVGPP